MGQFWKRNEKKIEEAQKEEKQQKSQNNRERKSIYIFIIPLAKCTLNGLTSIRFIIKSISYRIKIYISSSSL